MITVINKLFKLSSTKQILKNILLDNSEQRSAEQYLNIITVNNMFEVIKHWLMKLIIQVSYVKLIKLDSN